jgi:hypothetical protein
MAIPILIYRNETWTMPKRDHNNTHNAEIHFLRQVAGYTRLDHKLNVNIRKESEIFYVNG